MIYILSVHWHEQSWLERQIRYCQHNTNAEYQALCAVTGVTTAGGPDHWTFVETKVASHGVKLNQLARRVCEKAQADDWLVFIDGDAFPIADDWVNKVQQALKKAPFLAVQRLENSGERHPHPCFAVTTVGTWRKIKGDWRPGPELKDAEDRLYTDPGTRLALSLDQSGIAWQPLHRSPDTRQHHPIYFGVYGGIVYHHGAGFRKPISRLDRVVFRRRAQQRAPFRFAVGEALHKWMSKRQRNAGWYQKFHPKFAEREQLVTENLHLQSVVLQQIDRGPDHFRQWLFG